MKMRNKEHHNPSDRCLKEKSVPFRHRRSVLGILGYQDQEEQQTDKCPDC